MSLRIEIERGLCDSSGVCEEIIPEALQINDEDQLVLRLPVIPSALHERAREAVKYCPKQALRLVDDEAPERPS